MGFDVNDHPFNRAAGSIMAPTQAQAGSSARDSVTDVERDVKTLDTSVTDDGDEEKAPARKAKPGEAWKSDEVHKIPHK